MTNSAEILRRASERSSAALEARIIALEREVAALRSKLEARAAPAVVRRGDRVVIARRFA